MSYSDLNVWSFLIVISVLLFSMLFGNILNHRIPEIGKKHQ